MAKLKEKKENKPSKMKNKNQHMRQRGEERDMNEHTIFLCILLYVVFDTVDRDNLSNMVRKRETTSTMNASPLIPNIHFSFNGVFVLWTCGGKWWILHYSYTRRYVCMYRSVSCRLAYVYKNYTGHKLICSWAIDRYIAQKVCYFTGVRVLANVCVPECVLDVRECFFFEYVSSTAKARMWVDYLLTERRVWVYFVYHDFPCTYVTLSACSCTYVKSY